MIAINRGEVPLSAVQAYGLDVLLDLARLIPAPAELAGIPHLRIVPDVAGHEPDTALAERAPECGPGTITLGRGTLGAIGRLAGASAEQRSTAEDRHGRVPTGENPLGSDGLWLRPLVSLAAQRLRACVVAGAPHPERLRFVAPWPLGKRWAVGLSHDLDLVSGWGFAAGLRLLELVRHGAPASALRVVGAALGEFRGRPVEVAIDRLLARLDGAGIRATWFVICETPSFATWRRGDVTYRPDSLRVRALLRQVVAAGHEVGLHGSFATMEEAGRFAVQRARLEALVGRPVRGVRQHFLRMRPGPTQRQMLAAGFGYDATYGFADRSGYRLATADVLPGWDEQGGQRTALDEVPLHWMDRTLSKYQGVETPEAWVADGLARADEARAVEGLWVGLWHPNLSTPLGFPGTEQALGRLLEGLAAGSPWFAPLGEVVEWRRQRRAVTIVGVTPGGTPIFGGPRTVPIEDLDGRPVSVERSAA